MRLKFNRELRERSKPGGFLIFWSFLLANSAKVWFVGASLHVGEQEKLTITSSVETSPEDSVSADAVTCF